LSFSSSDHSSFFLSWLENITWNLFVASDGLLDVFLDSLRNTDNVFYLQTYEFTEKRIKKVFHELLRRDVDIKMIMENKKYKQYQDTFKRVNNEFSGYVNFELKSDKQMKTKYTHSKINILDDEFWIQTANLTHSSFFKNREHFFVSSNTGVYQSLLGIFKKDWEWKTIKLDDIHPNLLVCNINCRDVIETLLRWAKKSVIIQTQYISDADILSILWNKIEEGLAMKFLVSDTSSNDKLESYFWDKFVRRFTEKYNHTKMILVDDEFLILGSMNLSANSLDKNREIGIILIDENLISEFLEKFYQDWVW